MTKQFYWLLLAVLTFAQTSMAQAPLLFDKKFQKVQRRYQARYAVYLADSTRGEADFVMYGTDLSRIYAKGKVYPTDTLTFDGKILFDGRGDSVAVRYYKKGRPLPLLFTDVKLQIMPRKQATCYVAIGEDGEFYAYRFAEPYKEWIAMDMRTDPLWMQGRFSDIATMQLDGEVKYYENGKLTDIKKFKKGVLIPFIESTADYPEPYEIIGVVSSLSNKRSIASLAEEHKQFLLKCTATGADGVIGIKTTFTARSWDTGVYGYDILIQGTTIRLKNRQ